MTMTLNWEMLKGILERIATSLAVYLVAKGWIPKELGGDFVLIVILIGQAAWGAKVNTQASLVQAAASMPDVSKVVMPDSSLAKALDQGPTAKVSAS